MSKPYDGGPAFARDSHIDAKTGLIVQQNGMSLRDWFAGQVLASSLAYGYTSPDGRRWVAEHAYAQADAMLAERLKGGGK